MTHSSKFPPGVLTPHPRCIFLPSAPDGRTTNTTAWSAGTTSTRVSDVHRAPSSATKPPVVLLRAEHANIVTLSKPRTFFAPLCFVRRHPRWVWPRRIRRMHQDGVRLVRTRHSRPRPWARPRKVPLTFLFSCYDLQCKRKERQGGFTLTTLALTLASFATTKSLTHLPSPHTTSATTLNCIRSWSDVNRLICLQGRIGVQRSGACEGAAGAACRHTMVGGGGEGEGWGWGEYSRPIVSFCFGVGYFWQRQAAAFRLPAGVAA